MAILKKLTVKYVFFRWHFPKPHSKNSTPTLIWDPTLIDFESKFTPLRLFHTLRQFERLEYVPTLQIFAIAVWFFTCVFFSLTSWYDFEMYFLVIAKKDRQTLVGKKSRRQKSAILPVEIFRVGIMSGWHYLKIYLTEEILWIFS